MQELEPGRVPEQRRQQLERAQPQPLVLPELERELLQAQLQPFEQEPVRLERIQEREQVQVQPQPQLFEPVRLMWVQEQVLPELFERELGPVRFL